jgi:hypothetical protein
MTIAYQARRLVLTCALGLLPFKGNYQNDNKKCMVIMEIVLFV